jgi:hypothetical protein
MAMVGSMVNLWVASLEISFRTAQKIISLHNIQIAEVRDAVVCQTGLSYVWDEDPERGLRAIVKISIRGRKALVILYPRADRTGDAYNLGSAYFDDE